MDVLVEQEENTDKDPGIVAYRRRVKPSGKLFDETDDDDWSYIIDDILQMTVAYSKSQLDNPPKSTDKHLIQKHITNHTEILKIHYLKFI